MRFKDKTVIITGASGGVGQKLTPAFLSEGANVCAAYYKNRPLFTKGSVQIIQGNLALPEDAERIVRSCADHFGQIDILINCAAVTSDNFIEKMSFDEWQKVVTVNMASVFNVSKYALTRMKEKRSGHIITISSIVGEIGAIGCSNYVATKAGIVGFTLALAKEAVRDGIFANSLILGYFDVGLGARLNQSIREKITATIPMRRFGSPDDIIKAVFFLAETEYMTGCSLRLSGGL